VRLYDFLMNFRRYYIPGSAIFITQVVQNREPIFHNPQNIVLLREILRNVKELHPFVMLGYVFLLDHFHLIIQPIGESNFSGIMLLSSLTSRGNIKNELGYCLHSL
jgi:putative transposase